MPNKCIAPGCSRGVAVDELKSPKARLMGLCRGCRSMVTFRCVPRAGYIPTATTTIIGNRLLAHVSPTAHEALAACRVMRGPRHLRGNWDDRPPPSLHLLFNNAPIARRLPTILVGRRADPTISAVFRAFTEWHLAHRVIGQNAIGNPYPNLLAGMHYFGRRGLCKPRGSENTIYRHGEHKVVKQTYHLNWNDFKAVGNLLITKAAPKAGLDAKDRRIGDLIEGWYYQGIAEGTLRPHLVVPHGTFTTTASGDHPFDLRLPKAIPGAPQYQGKIRRAGGTIGGIYPEGLDDLFRSYGGAGKLIEYRPPAVQLEARPPAPSPDTSWVFG